MVSIVPLSNFFTFFFRNLIVTFWQIFQVSVRMTIYAICHIKSTMPRKWVPGAERRERWLGTVLSYRPALTNMHSYTKHHIFWVIKWFRIWLHQWVTRNSLIASTNWFGDKCMHQFAKHVYHKLPANFDILKIEIEKNALDCNIVRYSSKWD